MLRPLVFLSTVFVVIAPCVAQPTLPGEDFNPWARVIPAKDVPPVTEWRDDDTEGKVKSRTEEALNTGPDALETLGQKLLTEESRDGDGRYTMPYFYRVIGDEGRPIRGMERLMYQRATVKQWREKYPESLVAMVAEARLCNVRAFDSVRSSPEAISLKEHYQMVEGICRESLALLEKAKELKQKDPGWHVTRLIVLGLMDNKGAPFESAVDDLVAAFPECGYALARAVMAIQTQNNGGVRMWEGWLRGKLSKLPPDVAAKAYVRTIFERGLSNGTSEALWGVIPDRTMIHRGWDAWAKDYPNSIGLASEEAKLAAFALYEPIRIRAALRRAGGRIDQMIIKKEYYESVIYQMTRVPWEPKRVGLPDITQYSFGEVAGFKERMEKAAAEGPRGLETLIQHLRSTEIQDKDGRYLSCAFFKWFDMDVERLSDLKAVIEKERLIAQWREEFPASPFANLAAAHHWLGRAWDARGGNYAYSVRDEQWDGFKDGMKKAAKFLGHSEELRESEPAWMTAAMQLLLGTQGGGLDSEEYEQVTGPMFENFPESVECLLAIIHASKPRWGGKAGEWEPFLRKNLEQLPEDVKARSYALAVVSTEGYSKSYENRAEIYGQIKPDKALLKKGLASLVQKYPDSQLVANMEAMAFSDLSEEPERAYAAMKRMNGTLDIRLWHDYYIYHRFVRWVTWKKSPPAK